MEQRRIMSLGRSSLVISLPKYWTQMAGLKAGDIVSVAVSRDRSLIVYPGLKKEKELNEVTLYIEPDENSFLISKKIAACYLNGYSVIRLLSKNYFTAPQQRVIRRVAQMLYMRIMEADVKELQLTTLMDESKSSIKASISRMYKVSSSMCHDVFTALEDHNADLARSVYGLNREVNHFSFFLLRIIRKASRDPSLASELGLDIIDCLDYQFLTYCIKSVADQAANVARYIIMLERRKKRISDLLLKKICATGRDASEIFDKAFAIFSSNDLKDIGEIIEKREEVKKSDEEIAALSFSEERHDVEAICACCAIRDSIQRIADVSINIADIAINRFCRPQ